ncbi:MAG: hypothetical protein II248_02785 [Paludibacteraceae bacterium]|nr:hypothetical protein [Paludibacteraceae bacterium]
MADKLNPLIQHQKVFMIDAHGHEEIPDVRKKLYDDTKYDLHFHKKTNPISINGKKECTAEIRIPVNNPDREISVEISDNDEDAIPRKLKKEIKEALKNRNTREEFVKELGKIMNTYPSSKNNREKTEDALRRFAYAFGINSIPIIDEWFTHIDQDKNNVSMLSLISTNNERFNLLTYKNFMFAEQAEPSKKIIITLMGLAQRGKTETITLAFQRLLDKYSRNAIIVDDGKDSGDVKAILFINGAKVGIESQGDPHSRQARSVDEFVSMGCDVILVAGRTRGMTRNSITKYKDTHEIVSYHKYHTKCKESYHQVNCEIARSLTRLVEHYVAESFEEL